MIHCKKATLSSQTTKAVSIELAQNKIFWHVLTCCESTKTALTEITRQKH